jgi:methylphosphotriester-DNA--protein-cysteine methyltransferase
MNAKRKGLVKSFLLNILETKISLVEYMQRKRVQLALELLDKGLQINDVHKKKGFKNST